MGDLVGQVLKGRYKLVRPIGTGGMGTVYEAVLLDLNRRVALKVLDDREPRALARFRQEALAAASIQHPNVVAVTDFDAGDGEDPPFIAMELLPGHALSSVLARDGSLPVERAVKLAIQMLEGLAAAHALGIVHRDVKPANVFLIDLPDGNVLVKVLDFGIAKMLEEDGGVRTTTGTFLGTPAYVAPEQLRGTGVDPRTDLHAVSLCLHEMITGERVFKADTRGDLASKVLGTLPPRIARHDVSPELAAIIGRGLAKEKDDRWPDARTMLGALRATLNRSSGSHASSPRLPASGPDRVIIALPQPEVVRPDAPKERALAQLAPFALTLVVTVLLGGVGGALFLATRGSSTTAPTAPPPIAPPSLPASLVDADASLVDGGQDIDASPRAMPSSVEEIASGSPRKIQPYGIKSIVVEGTDPTAASRWIARNNDALRACVVERPCHDSTNWYRLDESLELNASAAQGTWTRSPGSPLSGCPESQRARIDDCIAKHIRRDVPPHGRCDPVNVAEAMDAGLDRVWGGCPVSITVTFYR